MSQEGTAQGEKVGRAAVFEDTVRKSPIISVCAKDRSEAGRVEDIRSSTILGQGSWLWL
jgi:hypothetical protein